MNLLKIIFLFFCTWMTGELTAQTPFERYFLDKTLRFDYYHCGDSRNQEYFFDELKEEPYWAGSKVSLLDDTGYGVQLFKIFDKASGKEIYSRSYCTLFNEWQTTPEAQTVRKAMPESVVFPYPKNEVRIEIYARNRKGVFEKKFEQDIDPNSYFVKKFTPRYETFEVAYNGNPSTRVDIGIPRMRRRNLQLLAGCLLKSFSVTLLSRRMLPVLISGRCGPLRWNRV